MYCSDSLVTWVYISDAGLPGDAMFFLSFFFFFFFTDGLLSLTQPTKPNAVQHPPYSLRLKHRVRSMCTPLPRHMTQQDPPCRSSSRRYLRYGWRGHANANATWLVTIGTTVLFVDRDFPELYKPRLTEWRWPMRVAWAQKHSSIVCVELSAVKLEAPRSSRRGHVPTTA